MLIFLLVFSAGFILAFLSLMYERSAVGLNDEAQEPSYGSAMFILVGFTLLAFILGKYSGGM